MYDLKYVIVVQEDRQRQAVLVSVRTMARVDGKPKMVSERYLGSVADIEALLEAREVAVLPERTRHLGFGDVAAAWGMFHRLDVAGIIDSVVGSRRADAGASVGTYLVLAALNRLVAPCSNWGSPTGGALLPRTGSPASAPQCWTTAGSGTPCTPSLRPNWPAARN